MDSVLTTVKQMLGITKDYTAFDIDIIVHINSAFMTLNQLGVGPEEGFTISGDKEAWNSFTRDPKLLEMSKLYVFYKTRLGFDPPTSSFVVEAIKNSIRELEWRLNVAAEGGKTNVKE